jgi:hypothetical protein
LPVDIFFYESQQSIDDDDDDIDADEMLIDFARGDEWR